MIGRLFGSDDSDGGCIAHHWGDYSANWDSFSTEVVDKRTTRIDGSLVDEKEVALEVVEISVQREAYCLHDGCHATDRGSILRHTIPKGAVIGSGEEREYIDFTVERLNREGPKAYAESLRELADELDSIASSDGD